MSKIIKEKIFEGQVVQLTLNAPKANILDRQMMAELQEELESLKSDRKVKLILFAGAGNHFSFGASVAEHVREAAPGMLAKFHQLFYTMIDLGIPTAARVSGQCLGGGLELALFCNFLFVDQSAKLGQPEIQLGVFAPPASLMLPLKIGQARADEILLTGRSITADEADKFGLITAVYENPEILMTGVNGWIEKYILPKSASSMKSAVKAARTGFNRMLRDNLQELEKVYIQDLMNTRDANEGIQAFLEKRQPSWEN